MTSGVAPIEMLAGVEGLALMRTLHEGDGAATRRLDELRTLLSDGDASHAPMAAESSARDGYASWSEHYDDPGNPIVELEQPVVWAMLGELPAGRALDAACGTGRHSRRLMELGWEVTGVDITPEMLDVARASVPGARFTAGDLSALPVCDAAVDLVVCGLAIGHVADLAPAVAELRRVLAPGGEAIISVLHPLQVALGWHAMFSRADGGWGFVREHAHSCADYLRAFRDCDLEVLDCVEPVLGPDEIRARRRLFAAAPEACEQAYAGLPAVLVWRVRLP